MRRAAKMTLAALALSGIATSANAIVPTNAEHYLVVGAAELGVVATEVEAVSKIESGTMPADNGRRLTLYQPVTVVADARDTLRAWRSAVERGAERKQTVTITRFTAAHVAVERVDLPGAWPCEVQLNANGPDTIKFCVSPLVSD